MILATNNFSLIQFFAGIDPGPFFVLSLIPYIFFLFWLQKSEQIPSYSLWGFRLTLLFVFMTIIFAVLAQVIYSDELTNIDPLHGAAEAFLTVSDALVLFGFIQLIPQKK
tara:strand:- start:61 stop:390 length:330 start_codon:yes stop_codon:yes gene_type:complete